MLKVAVALIVVVGLIASTEAWKRPGKPGRFSCDSNNLPDFVQKLGNPCDIESKVGQVLSQMTAENAAIAEDLLINLKNAIHDEFGESWERIMASNANLFTELQTSDPQGWAALQNVMGLYDQVNEASCEERGRVMTEFHQSLNAQGNVIMRKVFCHVMKDFKKTAGENVFKPFYEDNMAAIDNLKQEEGQIFRKLKALFRQEIKANF